MINTEKLLRGITEHQKEMFNRHDFEEKAKLHYQLVQVHNNINNLDPGTVSVIKILADKIESLIGSDIDTLVKLCVLANHDLTEKGVKQEIDLAMICLSEGRFEELDKLSEYVKMWNVAEAEFGKSADEFAEILKKFPKDIDLISVMREVMK